MADSGESMVDGMVNDLLRSFGDTVMDSVGRLAQEDMVFSAVPVSRVDSASLTDEEQRVHAFMQHVEREFSRLSERVRDQWIKNIETGIREGLARAVQQIGQDIRRRDQNRLERLILEQFSDSLSGGVRARFSESAGQIFSDALNVLSRAGGRYF